MEKEEILNLYHELTKINVHNNILLMAVLQKQGMSEDEITELNDFISESIEKEYNKRIKNDSDK